MNTNNGNESGNGHSNSSSSLSTIDIQGLESRPDLPHAIPRSTGTLTAPGRGGNGLMAPLASFTTVDAAGIQVFNDLAAASAPALTSGVDTEEPLNPRQTTPFIAEDAASAPDVDHDLTASEEQRGLEDYIRDMNIRGPQVLPHDAVTVPPFADPPFGIGVFAPVVTMGETAHLGAMATTAPAGNRGVTGPVLSAVNTGIAASVSVSAFTAPTAAPASGSAGPGSNLRTHPVSAAVPARRSHHEAFGDDGEPLQRPDGSLYLENSPPSAWTSSRSPSLAPGAAANATIPTTTPSPRPLAAPNSPHVAASPPHPPAISSTPSAPVAAASTDNTPEPTDPGLAEFFDFSAAST